MLFCQGKRLHVRTSQNNCFLQLEMIVVFELNKIKHFLHLFLSHFHCDEPNFDLLAIISHLAVAAAVVVVVVILK